MRSRQININGNRNSERLNVGMRINECEGKEGDKTKRRTRGGVQQKIIHIKNN